MAKAKKSPQRTSGSKKRGASGLVIMLLAAALCAYGTGIIDVDWSGGSPQVSVDRESLTKLGSSLKQLKASGSGQSIESAGDALSSQSDTGLAAGSNFNPPPTSSAGSPSSAPGGAETIKIASFNIQVFGTSKLQKEKAMQVLTTVVRYFDVVAIQEVRSTDDSVVPTFVNMINAHGVNYDFVIGPRLGRTNSKEQYTILFDTGRIEVDRSSVYTTPDPQDLLHREPMAATFRVRGVPANQAFSFTLVDIHTDPDETKTELNALADTFVGVQRNGSGEDDVILLGDLNVDEYHLGRLGQLPDIAHAITNTTTNTRHTKMYDNIVFNRLATTEYTGNAGVLDLMSTFGLSEADALQVSDHCPVWAEFSVYESGNSRPVAALPKTTR